MSTAREQEKGGEAFYFPAVRRTEKKRDEDEERRYACGMDERTMMDE